MTDKNFSIKEYIKSCVVSLRKKIDFNDKFEYSLVYYLSFKNDLYVKNLNINLEKQKECIDIQVSNFEKNINKITEISSKYPFANYDKVNKEFKYSYSNNHNLFSNTIKVKADIIINDENIIKTSQFMFNLFRNLEIITNYSISELKLNYDWYRLICDKMAYKYIAKIPEFTGFSPDKKLYFNVYSLTSYPNIITNYLDILNLIAPEFAFLNYYYITKEYEKIINKYNLMYNHFNLGLVLKFDKESFFDTIQKYMTYIFVEESEYYEELNIELSNILLNCVEIYIFNICKNDNIFIKKDMINFVNTKLPYKYNDGQKKELFKGKIHSIISRLEANP